MIGERYIFTRISDMNMSLEKDIYEKLLGDYIYYMNNENIRL
jgi:hypothetical protein